MRTTLLALVLTAPLLAQSNDWTTWRGPTGDGIAAASARPPLTWSEDTNVRWKTALPGLGASTPIVLGERLYLTCAVPESGFESEDGDVPQPPREPHALLVLAYDKKTGDEVWRRTVKTAAPHEKLHPTSSLASASIATDGARLFAFFGSHGVFALDLDGEVLWSKDLGKMATLAEFGEGATPVLAGDALVIPWDHEGQSCVLALDKQTGDERWRTPRECDSSWGSPVVAGEQVILTGSDATRAYAVADGKLVWTCGGMSKNPVNSPTVVDGIAYVMNTYKGNVMQALRLDGARGELADTEQVLWTYTRSGPYVPNPIVADGLLYFTRNSTGVLNCLDAKSGEERYVGQRLAGLRTVHSSPVLAAGRLYVASRDGAVAIVKAGAEFELLGVNRLDDCFDALPVMVGEDLFLRGRRFLYCVAERE